MKNQLRLIATAFAIVFITGCGGGGGGGSTTTTESSVAAPVITKQPISASVYESQTATFSVTASSKDAVTYQWKKNNVNIPGATSDTYNWTNAALADNGSTLSVAVTSTGGTTTSATATLNVQAAAPSIVTAPTPKTVLVGQAASFTVTANGMPSLSYQWLRNGAAIQGANQSAYSAVMSLGNNGDKYSVKVTNSAGSVTSGEAQVAVLPGQNELVISEVSSCYYYDVGCWFEIYNPTTSAINLSSYAVKTYSIDATVGGPATISTFALPSITIPSDGYVVISGNAENLTQRNNQNIRLRSGNRVPFWNANGFIELLNSGATADFIRFGSVTQTPVTTSKWTGQSVSAMPSSATDYGKAIVRLYPRIIDTNTHSAADWTSVNWATPGGMNDVPASAIDADGDGIPNTAKISGGTFAGLDLYAMGARQGRKAIFIEVDSMQSSDPGVKPRKESLQKVVDSFAAHGIDVFFDAGNLFSSTFSVADFNLGQPNGTVAYEPCVTLDQVTCTANQSNMRSIYDWKDTYMDLRRRAIFHYLLLGNSQKADGSAGSSGVAELPGNDFLVTMGSWGFSANAGQSLNKLINMQASTIMHELGHNLGLRHGGFENTNYKPNYWSIMNYMYQLDGLDPDPASATAYQRWLMYANNDYTIECSLIGSPCGDKVNFVISYSDGTGSALDESSLSEAQNMGRGAKSGAYADWDRNASITSALLSVDINGDGHKSVLSDYNDWANLVFPFARQYAGNAGRSILSQSKPALNPVSADRQEAVVEAPPPAARLQLLRLMQQR
ncbi:zinc-dependent metalloprotease family protein [Rhodoferax sp. GW822-FHT02A01]|uniref:zinc-dependent metalloprotease family protein n=1 Tax=Rhodoferax sp. GW822-FHT02A01 TaxID=3141537 RepID=UPI00315D645A